jgi:hypothetical protein
MMLPLHLSTRYTTPVAALICQWKEIRIAAATSTQAMMMAAEIRLMSDRPGLEDALYHLL